MPYTFKASPERYKQVNKYMTVLFVIVYSNLAVGLTIISISLFTSLIPEAWRVISATTIIVIILTLFLIWLLLMQYGQHKWSKKGEVIRIEHAGFVLAGETYIPWEQVTYCFGFDLKTKYKEKYINPHTKILLNAGTNYRHVLIGVRDIENIKTSLTQTHVIRGKIKGITGTTPGLIELPFGIYLSSADFKLFMEYMTFILDENIPVKELSDETNYEEAKAVYQSDNITIQTVANRLH